MNAGVVLILPPNHRENPEHRLVGVNSWKNNMEFLRNYTSQVTVLELQVKSHGEGSRVKTILSNNQN